MLVVNDELYHYGVPGMKWGVRKDKESSKSLMKKQQEKIGSAPKGSLRSRNKAVKWLSRTATGSSARKTHEITRVLGGQKQQAINTPIVTRAKAHAKTNQILLGVSDSPVLKSMDYAGLRASWRANKIASETFANINTSKLKSDPEYARVVAAGYKYFRQATGGVGTTTYMADHNIKFPHVVRV